FPGPWSTPTKTARWLMRETYTTSTHQEPTERSHGATEATHHQRFRPPAEAQCRRQDLFRLLQCEPHQLAAPVQNGGGAAGHAHRREPSPMRDRIPVIRPAHLRPSPMRSTVLRPYAWSAGRTAAFGKQARPLCPNASGNRPGSKDVHSGRAAPQSFRVYVRAELLRQDAPPRSRRV